MKNFRSITLVSVFALLFAVGCSVSTANMSSLKSSKDQEGKTEASAFTRGDTVFGLATISNNPGKVKVHFSLQAEDVKDMKPGEILKGSEVSVELPGDGVAKFNVNVTENFPPGTYKLNADMLNEAGEKKDGKSVTIKVTQPEDKATPPEE